MSASANGQNGDARKYEVFDLLVERLGEEYQFRVVASPGGEAVFRLQMPFSGEEIERLHAELGRRRRGLRRVESFEIEALQAFGGVLFDAVFGGDVGACLERSREQVAQRGHGLRLRLRLTEVPELAELPWEFLYQARHNRFLGRSTETPLVRYQELPEPIRPLTVKPPVRVLAVAASPTNYSSIGVEEEWAELERALAPLERSGRLHLERLEPATLSALASELQRNAFHILHFVGHGGFSERRDDGFLVFEDDDGRGHPVDCQILADHIHEHPSLRLAVLNACEGARGSRSDPFSGIVQTLARRRIPAVVGMQFEIPDRAAVTFAGRFYEALVDGSPVDVAAAAARKAMFAAGFEVDWGAPVVYMRTTDARLFRILPVSPPSPLPPASDDPIDRLVTALLRKGRSGTAVAYSLAVGFQTVGWVALAVLLSAVYVSFFDPVRSIDTYGDWLLVLGALPAAPVGFYFGLSGVGRALARHHSPAGSRLAAWLAGALALVAVLAFFAQAAAGAAG